MFWGLDLVVWLKNDILVRGRLSDRAMAACKCWLLTLVAIQNIQVFFILGRIYLVPACVLLLRRLSGLGALVLLDL
jgi:hypothetical protein